MNGIASSDNNNDNHLGSYAKENRRPSIATFPDDNFQNTITQNNSSIHSDGTISSDDDVEFIDSGGQTKYSVLKEEITPAESRIESAATSRATNPNTPFQTIHNGNNGEAL